MCHNLGVMNIADIRERSKELLGRIPPSALTVAILVLSCTAAFWLGIMAGRDMGNGAQNKDFWVEERGSEALGAAALPGVIPVAQAPVTGTPGVGFVASKSGKKYYLPTCSGVARIKEANRVWFATKEDAEAVGLTPAANCPGI